MKPEIGALDADPGWKSLRPDRPAGEARVTVASWLIVIETGRVASVRQALSTRPGIECRSEARGTLVVLSESPPDALEAVHATLRSVPGVRDAALVATFEDESER